jgi:hypothetical protein
MEQEGASMSLAVESGLAFSDPDIQVRVMGPSSSRSLPRDACVINTTSRSSESWSRALSPFFLGPIAFDDGRVAKRMENAWQFSKVYPGHVDADGHPNDIWRRWSAAGFASDRAERYPMGRGAKPLYLWTGSERLDYIEARREVYFPLYRDAVGAGNAFVRLVELAKEHRSLYLWDFDGYDHDASGMRLSSVIANPTRPMGHAFVLKAMLLYGRDIRPDQVADCEALLGPRVAAAPVPATPDLFSEHEQPESAAASSAVSAMRPRA